MWHNFLFIAIYYIYILFTKKFKKLINNSCCIKLATIAMSKTALVDDVGSVGYGATDTSSREQYGVSFHNLSYTVRGLFNKTGKLILNDLSYVTHTHTHSH